MNQTFDEQFNEQYTRLNSAQKEAVDTIEGPVIVIAGPGTGKTTILTFRIANILKQTDTEPEQILALTFTESGVTAMRRKLLELIGPEAYRVKIFTFHGFCNSVIDEFPQYFPKIIGGSPANEIDQIKIIQSLLEEKTWQKLTPYGNPFFYVAAIKSHISDLKREGISSDDFKKYVAERKAELENVPDEDKIHQKGAHKGKVKADHLKDLERNMRDEEFAEMYVLYEESLREKNLFDFDDSIGEVVAALKEHQDLKQILQEEHQYLLADEHQDTNQAQNTILELLADFHESPNIFIVGDEKQAIFRFQGASLANFLYFGERYPTTKKIKLDQNYRSTQPILDASYKMISENETPDDLKVELKAHREHKLPHIDLFEAENEDQEIAHLIHHIQKDLKAGKDPSSIACIVRHNADITLLSRYFAAQDIPVVMHVSQDLLLESFTQHIIRSLEAVLDLTNTQCLAEALFAPFWDIEYFSVHEICQKAYREGGSVFGLLQSDPKTQNITKTIQDLAERASQTPILDFLEEFWVSSESLDYALGNGPESLEYQIIQSLYQEARKVTESHPGAKLADFIDHIHSLQEHGTLQGSRKRNEVGVQLMTAHRSKGLEFDTVFIPFLHDKKWSGRKSNTYFSSPVIGFESDVSDERRLLYVALTRAEQNLFLSYHTENADGKELLPSRFLAELDENIVDTKKCDAELKLLVPTKKLGEKTPAYEALLKVTRDYILHKSLSITALNKYMDDPWHFFFVTILRVPQTLTMPQVYGTAVHDLLHQYQKHIERDASMDENAQLEFFQGIIQSSALSEGDKKTLLEKGEKNIPGYISSRVWKTDTLTEKKHKTEIETDLDGVTTPVSFTGIIDAIELNTPSAGDTTVVDFKTGKPKSRNELLGNTQAGNGDYHRQLLFYALLLQKNGQETPKQGIIEFVEATEKGDYKKEIFEIMQEEIDGLETLLKETIAEIYSGAFLKEAPEQDHQYYALWKAVTEE